MGRKRTRWGKGNPGRSWGRLIRIRWQSARPAWRAWVVCAAVLIVGAAVVAIPWGCSPKAPSQSVPLEGHTVRVRIVPGAERVLVQGSQPPLCFSTDDPTQRQLDLPPGTGIPIVFTGNAWRVGSATLRGGTLTLVPASLGSLSINDKAYRGQYRLVPVGGNRFDVVNEVELDDYLKGVLAVELYAGWHPECYRALAIAARTYSLYEKHLPRPPRHWDLHADERSQVYGGIGRETAKSREAVDATAGVVLAYGPKGNERIFKTYYSSCCGGASQSVTDAFNEPFIEPLSEQGVGMLCSASPRFNWGPVVIPKEELTRRFRAWGQSRNRPEAQMSLVRSVEIEARNRYGRPVRYVVTDVRGLRYSLRAEDLRWAVNASAGGNNTLFSSFVENVINESDRIRFVGGHGSGHGVGLCQWCAEARARGGMRHEEILLASYPGAKLVRAY